MIQLKILKWSNLFSYGTGNILYLDQFPIMQLVGKNGHGKSSIPLIIEECLYNKNSKGIKKADILNRYINDKSYSISLEFSKDGDEYIVEVKRGSSSTIRLIKNGEDISAHTATNTYKLLEDILGFDSKTFSQLIYQSSTSSLEFLTATDTNRKKFLIDLLNLTKYTEAFEVFKALAKEINDSVIKIESKISATQGWLDKHSKADLSIKQTVKVPEPLDNLSTEIGTLRSQVESIESTNKRIIQNNQYRKLLEAIPAEDLVAKVDAPVDTKPLVKTIAEHEASIKSARSMIKRIKDTPDNCPTCKQAVDNSALKATIVEHEAVIASAQEELDRLTKVLEEAEASKKLFDKVTKSKTDWESYHSLIDETLDSNLFDKEDLEERIRVLNVEIKTQQVLISNAQEYNTTVETHNAKVALITEQLESFRSELSSYTEELKVVSEKLNIVQLLQKTFSTNGLIAYKIECMVKDLEDLTNTYLGELSDGRFQITFQVSSSDKLNVIITDNGKDIDILALSSGERTRVNTATLLAIRKLMQSLSSTRINLLILDETIESLDTEGKEKLVEILTQEEHLNTILVSHGYTHPLLEKVQVVKENNISRIEV